MKSNRPDLDAFAPGALYRHSATGEIVEFLGVAHAERDGASEDIGLFRFVNQDTPPLAANRAGYDAGETFEPVRAVEPRPSKSVPRPRASTSPAGLTAKTPSASGGASTGGVARQPSRRPASTRMNAASRSVRKRSTRSKILIATFDSWGRPTSRLISAVANVRRRKRG
jgi:hypothetical protein